MWLDYSSTTLSGVPVYLLNRLQYVVFDMWKYDHVTHLFRDLHRLWVPERDRLPLSSQHGASVPRPWPVLDRRGRSATTYTFQLSPTTDHATNTFARLATVHATWWWHGHGTVFLLVSLQYLHWLCSEDNCKHSCSKTLFLWLYILIIDRVLQAILQCLCHVNPWTVHVNLHNKSYDSQRLCIF